MERNETTAEDRHFEFHIPSMAGVDHKEFVDTFVRELFMAGDLNADGTLDNAEVGRLLSYMTKPQYADRLKQTPLAIKVLKTIDHLMKKEKDGNIQA